MIKDLTHGEPIKLMMIFSIPLLIGNIFQQFYNIADIIIVGRTLGMNALAAVGAVSPLFFLIMFIIIGLTNGFAVITGQRFGAKDYNGVRRSFVVSTVLSYVFTIIFSVFCSLFLKRILYFMNVPSEIFNDAYWYTLICVIGLVISNFYNLLANVIRALGDSLTPLYALVIASVVNIFLALVFILKLGLGVPGSAFALIFSQGISGILCMIYIKYKMPVLHLSRSHWHISKNDIPFAVEHLRVGLPTALQFAIIGVSILIIQAVCNSFGADIIASFTAALRIEQIAILPMVTFGIAVATFVAQNFGARYYSRIKNGVKKASLINFILSMIMAIVMYFWGSDLVRLFIGSENDNIVKIAHSYLTISSMFYFFLAQIFIYRNALQGLGRPVIPLIVSIGELVMRSFCAICLAGMIGYYSVFYSGPVSWVTASIVVAIGYYTTINRFFIKSHKKFKSEFYSNNS